MEFGLEIEIEDWGLRLGIGEYNWGIRLGLGIGIEDWDWGLRFGIWD